MNWPETKANPPPSIAYQEQTVGISTTQRQSNLADAFSELNQFIAALESEVKAMHERLVPITVMRPIDHDKSGSGQPRPGSPLALHVFELNGRIARCINGLGNLRESVEL